MMMQILKTSSQTMKAIVMWEALLAKIVMMKVLIEH